MQGLEYIVQLNNFSTHIYVNTFVNNTSHCISVKFAHVWLPNHNKEVEYLFGWGGGGKEWASFVTSRWQINPGS